MTSRMRVLLCIYQSIRAEGRSPRFRDIAERVGLHLSSVQWHIHTLKKDGLLRHAKYSKRALELTPEGEEAARTLEKISPERFGRTE